RESKPPPVPGSAFPEGDGAPPACPSDGPPRYADGAARRAAPSAFPPGPGLRLGRRRLGGTVAGRRLAVRGREGLASAGELLDESLPDRPTGALGHGRGLVDVEPLVRQRVVVGDGGGGGAEHRLVAVAVERLHVRLDLFVRHVEEEEAGGSEEH